MMSHLMFLISSLSYTSLSSVIYVLVLYVQPLKFVYCPRCFLLCCELFSIFTIHGVNCCGGLGLKSSFLGVVSFKGKLVGEFGFKRNASVDDGWDLRLGSIPGLDRSIIGIIGKFLPDTP